MMTVHTTYTYMGQVALHCMVSCCTVDWAYSSCSAVILGKHHFYNRHNSCQEEIPYMYNLLTKVYAIVYSQLPYHFPCAQS